MSLQAVRLLKKGGVLVYSTCTVTLAENEEQVAWALDTFPCLSLVPQVKHLSHMGVTANVKITKWNLFFLFFRSPTSVLKACLEPAFHLSSCASSRGSVPSWAGSRRKLQPRSPAEPTATLSASLSLSSWKTNPRARALARGSYETAKREQ